MKRINLTLLALIAIGAVKPAQAMQERLFKAFQATKKAFSTSSTEATIASLKAQEQRLRKQHGLMTEELAKLQEQRTLLSNRIMHNTMKAMILFPAEGRKTITLASKFDTLLRKRLMTQSLAIEPFHKARELLNNDRDLISYMEQHQVPLWKTAAQKRALQKQSQALDKQEQTLFEKLYTAKPFDGNTNALKQEQSVLNDQIITQLKALDALKREQEQTDHALQEALSAENTAEEITPSHITQMTDNMQSMAGCSLDDLKAQAQKIEEATANSAAYFENVYDNTQW